MVGSVTRYRKLLVLFLKSDFYLQSAYTLNFFSGVVGKILRIVLVLLFFQTLVLAVPGIPQWGSLELSVLAATFYITDLIASVLFHRNLLFHLPREIHDGTFDRTLRLPVPTLFYTAFQRIDAGDFLATLPFIVFWFYIGQHAVLAFTAWSIVLYIVLVLHAIVFIFALTLLVGSTAFWFPRGDGFGRLIDSSTGAGRFPFTIFPKKFQFVVFYVFPLALLATIPTQALLGTAQPFQMVYVVGFTFMLFVVSLLVWKRGLRAYQSASS